MAQPSTKSVSGTVIRLSGLVALALGAFGLVVGAMMLYASMQGELDSEQAVGAIQEQARSMSDSLAEIQFALQSPQVVDLARGLLSSSSSRSDALDAAVQSRGVPNIIDLRVFPTEVEAISLGEYPKPDFTVIEMLLEARAEGEAPIQIHYPGQSIENLALAQAIETDAGVEGILFLRVPVSMVSSQLSVSTFIDSIELAQGRGAQRHAIRTFGVARGPLEITPIPGSRLNLSWTRRTLASAISKQAAVIVLSVGVILLMLGLLARQRFGALDMASFRALRQSRASAKAKKVDKRPAAASGRSDSGHTATSSAKSKRKSAAVATKDQAQSKRAKPSAAATQKAATPEPLMDDLPDWLLDSDQIDQSDTALGGLDDRADDLADDDDAGLVADTLFFKKNEAGSNSSESLEEDVEDKITDEVEDADAASDSDPSPNAAQDSAGSDGIEFERVDIDDVEFDHDQFKNAESDKASPEPAPAPDPSDDSGSAEGTVGWDDLQHEILREDATDKPDQQALADAKLAAEREAVKSQSNLSGDGSGVVKNVAEDNSRDEQAAKSAPTGPVLEPSLFMASSIGGVVGEHLDVRAATLIGEAIGSEARSRGIERIVVGRDGRLDGAALMSALTQGLQASGITVIDVGAVPIPVLNFAASELTDGSGVMVTGSHYPPEHNGFRIRLQNELLQDAAIQSIRQRIDTQDLTSGSGQLEEESIIERYIERIKIDIQLERPLKVVVDCGNGISGSVVPQVLSAIGADVIPLYADVDGTFPNHLPDPSNPDNLEDLKLCVRNFRADLGLAFDGDGDRLAMISPAGDVVWTDRVLMLLAPDILERNAGAQVVIDSASGAGLSELITAAGGKPVVERNAEAFVDRRMREKNALLGGLFSGHLFIAERWYPFDDAIYASARLLELLAADTRGIGDILDQLPDREATPEVRVPVDASVAEELVMALIADGDFGDGELSMVDGLRVDYPDGWGMIRASHRGQGLVLRFEADSKKALNRIKTTFAKQVKAQDASVKLPI